MGAPEVEAFLSHLAVYGHVASATQNQALSAQLAKPRSNLLSSRIVNLNVVDTFIR
ncbi:MAG TPA: hypothetical protein PKN13_13195 [Accumulibacter sp.]|uniref:hypothetical protein n=1 Tax=Accumulibacter sp. TaxID=2053492 RepID=UPI00287A936D|nr:hypothetical protein [Accumulibacter sp.]MDS4076993.1 hypothetical protein [Accumulibacter sp.]HMW18815.1 hypothetical protein [Accumulibacter sp.]HNC21295.1 hypothetical protein [Accumulibacter sp.]HND81391.1 hypothetical protein [Accumulibacter sp.]HNE14201.1 hypothetical protein [Accumulibacter sp.]